jgi:amino acid adenylation domain-containing protein
VARIADCITCQDECVYAIVAGSVMAASAAKLLPLRREAPADQLLLARWNATARPLPAAQTLPAMVEASCRHNPAALAVSAGATNLTYGELHRRVQGNAAALRAAGVVAGDVIGVQRARDAESIVLALAIMRTGAIYVPFDPAWPEQRTAAVTAISGARWMQREALMPLPAGDEVASEATPQSLAYSLFTSGSTGTPKGVEIEHRSICNHLAWFVAATSMTASDVVLFKTAPTFDASLVEMFAPLVAGARIVIGGRSGDLDPEGLVDEINTHGITLLQSVPSAARALLATGRLGSCTSLRYLVLGGEALDAKLAAGLHAALPAARIGNFYGPTETTIDATFHEIEDWQAPAVPIGRPVANMRCYVLDDDGQMLPVGMWGELFVAGVGVARGYCGRPDLTRERFLADPFVAGERMFRTGDQARWRDDGVLEYAGRGDGQIKIRGLRIELGEIEAVLRQLPGVADAAVVTTKAPNGHDDLLAAFVTCAAEDSMDAQDLRQQAALRLPAYMIPNRITVLEFLPMMSSGKADRVALALRAGQHAATGAETLAEPPATPLEAALLDLWREHLELAHVGVEADFFAHGGHSLLGFRLVAAIERGMQLTCTLQQLFHNPTVRQLAQALECKGRPPRDEVFTLQPQGARAPLYCLCGIQIYRALAQEMADGVPVHGVFLAWEEQALNDPRDCARLTVEEMARRYLAAIRLRQPTGVFSVLGFSFGGVLALEVARQCAAAGDVAPYVVILDMAPVELRGKSAALSIGAAWRRARAWIRSLRGETLDMEDAEQRRGRLHETMMDRYRTPLYDASGVLLVRATQSCWGDTGRDPALGWSTRISRLDTLDAPGDHLGILEGMGARTIARALRQRLPWSNDL